jgi:hypothetical protein
MPLPEKKSNETKAEFISRCMADSKTLEEFPEAPQRFAVCQAQWTK